MLWQQCSTEVCVIKYISLVKQIFVYLELFSLKTKKQRNKANTIRKYNKYNKVIESMKIYIFKKTINRIIVLKPQQTAIKINAFYVLHVSQKTYVYYWQFSYLKIVLSCQSFLFIHRDLQLLFWSFHKWVRMGTVTSFSLFFCRWAVPGQKEIPYGPKWTFCCVVNHLGTARSTHPSCLVYLFF